MSLIKKLRGLICGKKRPHYRAIQYNKNPRIPEENSERLIKYVAQDFGEVRNRTDHQCLFIGRFMGIVLLIEKTLVRLLSDFDEQIEKKMFGQKIEVYKDFLNAYDAKSSEEIGEFKALIAPMNEIKKLRDAMAHDLSKTSIGSSELPHTISYIRNNRQDLYQTLSDIQDEEQKSLFAIATFGFLFIEQLACIRCELQ